MRLSTEKKLLIVIVGLFSLREKAPTKNNLRSYEKHFNQSKKSKISWNERSQHRPNGPPLSLYQRGSILNKKVRTTFEMPYEKSFIWEKMKITRIVLREKFKNFRSP